MTDDKLRELSRLYEEKEMTAGLKSFLRNCSSFYFVSGSQECEIPDGLLYRVRVLVDDYYKELKRKQEEL